MECNFFNNKDRKTRGEGGLRGPKIDNVILEQHISNIISILIKFPPNYAFGQTDGGF